MKNPYIDRASRKTVHGITCQGDQDKKILHRRLWVEELLRVKEEEEMTGNGTGEQRYAGVFLFPGTTGPQEFKCRPLHPTARDDTSWIHTHTHTYPSPHAMNCLTVTTREGWHTQHYILYVRDWIRERTVRCTRHPASINEAHSNSTLAPTRFRLRCRISSR